MQNQKVCKILGNDLELDGLLDAIHEDILITDGNGRILYVSRSFEDVYGIKNIDIVGKTVYEMEKTGVFRPSVIAEVLRQNEKVTMRQRNNLGRDLVVTATPIRNEAGETVKVISFTRDLTDFLNLQEQYSALESQIEKYTAEIKELRSRSLEVDGIIAKSDVTQNIMSTINRIAHFDANVLLTGESGVGKTIIAKLIHSKSSRSKGPFIEINCGAIPENLFESEFFGYERGSFTGASREGKIGLVELAQSGTLLLDEISELSLNMQVKMLKTIQNKSIIRVGGTREIQVDFRLIAATNKDLYSMLKKKEFREDLFYRLNVISIEIPPLRERKDDIIPMARFFLQKFNHEYGLNKSISKEVFNIFLNYSWPGNVRDLENTIERLALISEKNIIDHNDLSADMLTSSSINENQVTTKKLNEALAEVEGQIIRNAYAIHKTSVAVAQALGISQPTAARKIKQFCK